MFGVQECFHNGGADHPNVQQTVQRDGVAIKEEQSSESRWTLRLVDPSMWLHLKKGTEPSCDPPL